MTAEAAASVQQVTLFLGNQVNIANEILQNLIKSNYHALQ